MIESFDTQSFSSWFASVDPHTQTLPAVQAISATKGVQHTDVLTCHLRSPVFFGSTETPIWRHLPARVSRQFEALQRDVKVSFFMRANAGARHLHVPLFRRRMTEKLGILSQYYDNVTGEYTLNQINTAQPVNDVGGGLYLNGDGSTKQLPMLDEFVNLSHFRIYTALGPVREAQNSNFDHLHLLFERQLKAVNDFCDSDQPAVVNFRHLLMTGGTSNPAQGSTLNLCGSSAEMSASFLSLLEQLKTDLGDPSQSTFLERLTDIKDNVIALTGPAGSGKTHLLHLTIWIVLFLGHKLLVCAVDEGMVEDLLVQVTNVQPSWVQGKSLLKFTQSNDSPEARIYAPTLDGLFTTLQHSGSDQLKLLDFKPSVVIICQAGKASIASTCIPITVFGSWETLLLVGDWHQSGPWFSKGTKSEVAEYSKKSAIEILGKCPSNTITLQLQHRMSRSIAEFPAKHFYGGQFQFHQTNLADNTRRKVRMTSSKYYQIKGNSGSEYFLLDVPNTQSRIEEGGDSPSNYGNATAIEELVQNLNNEGIPADDIVVLCLYKSQVTLLSKKVKASNNGTRGCREVRTVDSFHGRQAKVAIIDFVVAGPIATFNPGESRGGLHQKVLSDFVRDPHRINLALTRAKDGVIVVGQVALFVAVVFNGGALGNTLFWMVSDAMERRLVHSATNIVDNHPNAIYGREVSRVMADETEEDAALAIKNYNAFIRKKLGGELSTEKTGATPPA
ncbi:MAG: hypothetical protein L6R42_000834 [Xanthoria sp. 1 TBL-2021]|nr:MAG: hypothetical protein L6R42_000834 [Xanthoria sp. 1 TBL-2021]